MRWVKPEQVDDIGDWWWWNGDVGTLPCVVTIGQSGHKPNCTWFAQAGQYAWEEWRQLADLGGWWMQVKYPSIPELEYAGFCTLCNQKIVTFDGLARCPRCETTSKPCGYSDQLSVEINYHELRLICMWAENWADKHAKKETATDADKSMPDVVKAIALRLRSQLPNGKQAITMRDEFAELAKAFPGFQTNHPADDGEHPIRQ